MDQRQAPKPAMRYGDMRNQLHQAALLRAQRKQQEPENVAPSAAGPPVLNQMAQSPSRAANSTASDSRNQNEQQNSSTVRQQNCHPAAVSASDYAFNPADYDFDDEEIMSEQTAAAANTFASMNNANDDDDAEMGLPQAVYAQQVQAARDQRNRDQGIKWSTCLSEPSAEWKQRKCNLYMLVVCVILGIFADVRKCGIPLGFWLAGSFFFIIFETLNYEMRDRMNNSVYWDSHRGLKKCILGISGLTCSLGDMAWMIWGMTMYFSKDSDGCSEENWGFMFLMVMFLIYASLKICIVLVVLGIISYFGIARQRQRYNERAASSNILRSLSQVKYSALNIGRSDTDEMCSVCFVDYTDEDVVTKLDCNDKHIFHQYCISQWISQGKNSCPICRQPINSEIQL